MLSDIWEIYQQGQLSDAAGNAEAAKRDAAQTSDRLHGEVRRLEAKIDGLALLCQALWEIIRDNTDFRDEQIEAKMKEIDLRDGRQDGRMVGHPTKCRKCGRPAHTRQRVCMYCGTAIHDGHLAEKL